MLILQVMKSECKKRIIPRVRTLVADEFQAACTRLSQLVCADLPTGGYDVIVGVRRGGSIVCDAMLSDMPPTAYSLRADVKLQRPSTRRKGERLSKILLRLPMPVLDWLRIVESLTLDAKRRLRDMRGRKPATPVDIPDELSAAITGEAAPCVLIIDDAIDSGETLFSIITALKQLNAHAQIRVAALTVTTTDPRVDADYALHRDRTLLRLPWAADARN